MSSATETENTDDDFDETEMEVSGIGADNDSIRRNSVSHISNTKERVNFVASFQLKWFGYSVSIQY